MSTHKLTGAGDLYFDGSLRPYIDTEVEFLRFTKAGLCYVQTYDGSCVSVPKRNLEPPPQTAHNTGDAQ